MYLPHSGLADRIRHAGEASVSSLPSEQPEACPSGFLGPAGACGDPQKDSVTLVLSIPSRAMQEVGRRASRLSWCCHPLLHSDLDVMTMFEN